MKQVKMKILPLPKISEFSIEKSVDSVIIEGTINFDIDLIEDEMEDGEKSMVLMCSIDMKSEVV